MHQLREQLAAQVADAACELERFAAASRRRVGSPQYVCVMPSIGRFASNTPTRP